MIKEGEQLTRGLVLGKFMPPHAGHLLLCRTARALVDQLTILVCWLPDDPVAGHLRLAWMRELFPDCRVVGHDAVVPQSPDEHPDFWPIWRRIVQAAHPGDIDYIFASEAYGHRLAAEVGARYWPIDPGRDAAPVSATAIRSDPWGHWDQLAEPVRPFYARTICLHGVESTGKTWLAPRLALHLATAFVPEYGRTWCNAFGTDLKPPDLLAIARTHIAMTKAGLRRCNRRLILDTDPLMTAAWAEMLFGSREPWFDHWSATADLYLMLDIDLPWHDDGTRLFGGADERKRFHNIAVAELERRKVRWTLVRGQGEERLRNALAAIEAAGLAGARMP